MAIVDGQGEKGATRVIGGEESVVGDDVERLLATIVWMRAPADVGEQASGMPQPLFLRRFIEPSRGHEAIGPLDHLLAMARRARTEDVEIGSGGDEAVLLSFLSAQQRIEQPFPDAEHGDDGLPTRMRCSRTSAA